MRLCIDIDGTLCEIRQPQQSYADVQPLAGAVEKLASLRKAGHYIILATARHMKTCDANVGMVIARQGKVLLQWLEDHQIEYDEIWFGKPNADLYIDDRGYRFGGNWHEIELDELARLAQPETPASDTSKPDTSKPEAKQPATIQADKSKSAVAQPQIKTQIQPESV